MSATCFVSKNPRQVSKSRQLNHDISRERKLLRPFGLKTQPLFMVICTDFMEEMGAWMTT